MIWVNKLVNFIKRRKHVFIIKTNDEEDVDDIIKNVLSNSNSLVDVFSDCKSLFYELNKHKNLYETGIINKNNNNKRYTTNIITNMISEIDPSIKLVTYSFKPHSVKK